MEVSQPTEVILRMVAVPIMVAIAIQGLGTIQSLAPQVPAQPLHRSWRSSVRPADRDADHVQLFTRR